NPINLMCYTFIIFISRPFFPDLIAVLNAILRNAYLLICIEICLNPSKQRLQTNEDDASISNSKKTAPAQITHWRWLG
ncbi:hypothetical protein, partial [Crenothrix sp.]|uniref:hypothetical protein n=1 Tax=Crenothrix sp. TaxID=3100433 RepID=UPI00374DF062